MNAHLFSCEALSIVIASNGSDFVDPRLNTNVEKEHPDYLIAGLDISGLLLNNDVCILALQKLLTHTWYN